MGGGASDGSGGGASDGMGGGPSDGSAGADSFSCARIIMILFHRRYNWFVAGWGWGVIAMLIAVGYERA